MGGCSSQYQTFADYSSSRSTSGALGVDSCAELAKYNVKPAAIRLLRQDGLCKGRISGGRAPAARAVETQPGGGISWDEASRHVGTTQRVCGPLAGTGQSADDVFLNLGVDYPDPNRFTVVLWDVGSVRPPPGVRSLCVSGVITDYRGVPQIELRSIQAVDTYR